MLPIPLEQITEADLQRLVANKTAEGRTLEFKRELPGGKDDDVKEHLADVTSFANAQGGDLIFGVATDKGVAVDVCGLDHPDFDQLQQGIENRLATAVEPRLAGVRLQAVPLANGKSALILRIPGSLSSPHRVTFKKSHRFHARNSGGKYEMDTHELRQTFTASEQVPQKLRALHTTGAPLPFRLRDAPAATLSVIPISVLRDPLDLDVRPEESLAPVRPTGQMEFFQTLEGVVGHIPPDPKPSADYPVDFVRSYATTFRRGYAQTGWVIGPDQRPDRMTQTTIDPKPFEDDVLGMAIAAETWLRHYGLEGPWAVFLSISRVDGFSLDLGGDRRSQPAWRDGADLPELLVERCNSEALRPLLKAFWLLFGEVRRG